MTRASKLNDPVLFQRACDLVDEGFGRDALATELNISVDAARGFIQRYEMFGKDGAMCSHTPKVYTQAEKIEAVEYFLAGNSQSEACSRFGISNRSTLKRWVKKTSARMALQVWRPNEKDAPPTIVPAWN